MDSSDYLIRFGKFSGQSLGEIWELPSGPQWVWWAYENLDEDHAAREYIESLLSDEGIDDKRDLPWRG